MTYGNSSRTTGGPSPDTHDITTLQPLANKQPLAANATNDKTRLFRAMGDISDHWGNLFGQHPARIPGQVRNAHVTPQLLDHRRTGERHDQNQPTHPRGIRVNAVSPAATNEHGCVDR
ncbi:hypothetical protein JCM3263A_30770 [Thermobifida fusca]